MIRGVNKQVIEVSATENEYFERAILFVRSEKSDLAHKELKRQAGSLLQKLGNPSGNLRAASRLVNIARLASAATMGAAASALLIKLVF